MDRRDGGSAGDRRPGPIALRRGWGIVAVFVVVAALVGFGPGSIGFTGGAAQAGAIAQASGAAQAGARASGRCPAGSTLDEATGRCIKPPAKVSCPREANQSGSTCSVPATPTCPRGGTLRRGAADADAQCVSEADYRCPADAPTPKSGCVSTATYLCPTGWTQHDRICTADATYSCPGGGSPDVNKRCESAFVYTCNEGDRRDGTTCYTPAACTSTDDVLSDGQCLTDGDSETTRDPTCPPGTSGPVAGDCSYPARTGCAPGGGTPGSSGCVVDASAGCPNGVDGGGSATCTTSAAASCPRGVPDASGRCTQSPSPVCGQGTPAGTGTCVGDAQWSCPGDAPSTPGARCVFAAKITCASGFTPVDGLCQALACPAGTAATPSGECVPPTDHCPAGTISIGSGLCGAVGRTCPAGFVPTSSRVCAPRLESCPPGTGPAPDGLCRPPVIPLPVPVPTIISSGPVPPLITGPPGPPGSSNSNGGRIHWWLAAAVSGAAVLALAGAALGLTSLTGHGQGRPPAGRRSRPGSPVTADGPGPPPPPEPLPSRPPPAVRLSITHREPRLPADGHGGRPEPVGVRLTRPPVPTGRVAAAATARLAVASRPARRPGPLQDAPAAGLRIGAAGIVRTTHPGERPVAVRVVRAGVPRPGPRLRATGIADPDEIPGPLARLTVRSYAVRSALVGADQAGGQPT
jgi:hypothetical protein